MNNFIVSPQKDKQFKIWFRIALIAILLIYIKPLVFHIDSKDVTILGLKHILRSSWGNTLIYMFYWITFVWILGQLIMSFPTSMKWAKGSLWATLIFYVIHVLYSYIVPMPELGSPTLATYHLVGGVISTLYTASLILFGIHLVSRIGHCHPRMAIVTFRIFYILYHNKYSPNIHMVLFGNPNSSNVHHYLGLLPHEASVCSCMGRKMKNEG